MVPGRAQDATFRYATLYKNATPASTMQTSLKTHIDVVRSTGLSPIVRLLKVWRRRNGAPLPTFAMEIIAAKALTGLRKDDYAAALISFFRFAAQNVVGMRLEDPANTNNALDLSAADRLTVAGHASSALRARNWGDIVW